MENIDIKQLTTIEELTHMQKVEEAVWHMQPIPVHQTHTALNNGGITLGAFDGEKMVGFLYSFAGFSGGQNYLCSHMLGLLPAYQQGGLGVKMKREQAVIAREIGYEMITWTFDPLESLNAYVNLHKLGAIGAYYKENHYGSMDDELNRGLPTDRIQIEWYINDKLSSAKTNVDEAKVLLDMNTDGIPVITDAFYTDICTESDVWFMAVPATFQSIKQHDFQLAGKWRLETRKVFQALFSNGFKAVDIIRETERQLNYYVFRN